ncbi:hypothetical protein EDC94DRAFT_686121 [Helicostylum pulchrum]|nr:hypothetical protein EDC94DRAFT_686121 [Helicostylum pulchrum]
MFDFQNDELCSKKSSLLKINDVLPKEFLEQTLFTFTIIVSLFASEYFYDFNKLFEESNVRLINSYYFGTQSCLKKNPVQNNLFQMLETFELNRGEFRKSKENQKSSMDMAMELSKVKIGAKVAQASGYSDIDNNAFTFSRTDNGIVFMTNTVGFDLNRFRFHLQLSNRYQALGSSEDTINADHIVEKYKDNKYLNLPKSRVMES